MRLTVLLRVAAVGAVAAATACSSSGPVVVGRSSDTHATLPGSSTATTSLSPTKVPSTPSTADASKAARLLARMSLRQRVGQLLMVDCPSDAVAGATVDAISRDMVGSVILDGTTTAGQTAVRHITTQLKRANLSQAGLFIATDQEGGTVQRLQGPGFSTIPSGVDQGKIGPATLRTDAQRWGAELRAAGVNVDLAPVLDTVPVDSRNNPPIGDLDREYGRTPDTVASHGVAVAVGLADGGIDATVKHFPGLGRVTGNTDTTGGVTDSVTSANDPYLSPFRAAVKAKVPFVMMSTAVYSKLDPDVPAAFSRSIVTGMLRDSLGFDGVVISDDVGAARQVSDYSVGERAVKFVAAGGDIVLTVDASQAADMTQALIAQARKDPSFARLVDVAALRVLRAKQARGLLS